MSLVTDTLKSSMAHFKISIPSSRVVCGGIPVMSIVPVVASNRPTMHTYGDDGICLVQKNCASYCTRLMKASYKKNQYRQKKQHTFSFNRICSHLILLMLVFFPLSNCLT